MKSYLQHLESNEAVLLLYLANELPDQDRAEVEAMLASDPALRAALENLRKTQELAFDALESLDAITRPPMAPIAAQNRISKLMQEWLDRRRGLPAQSSASARRFPWWRTAFATAASLMIGYYIWAVYHAPPVHGLPAEYRPPHALTDNERLAVLYNSLEISNSEDANLVDHVAEVASVVPNDADDTTEGGSDSNSTGVP